MRLKSLNLPLKWSNFILSSFLSSVRILLLSSASFCWDCYSFASRLFRSSWIYLIFFIWSSLAFLMLSTWSFAIYTSAFFSLSCFCDCSLMFWSCLFRSAICFCFSSIATWLALFAFSNAAFSFLKDAASSWSYFCDCACAVYFCTKASISFYKEDLTWLISF